MSKKYEFILNNLSCANCANKIQTGLAKKSEFANVNVNFNTAKLSFESTHTGDVKEIVSEFVKTIEDDIEVVDASVLTSSTTNNKSIIPIVRIIIGLAIIILVMLVKVPSIIEITLIIIAYALLLYRTFLVAVNKIFKHKIIDENTLITISAVGAFLVGQHMEGFMVIFLYEVGKILEDRAVNKSRKSIKELMDIRPEYANVKIESEIKKVSPEEVNVGDIIIVKAGEKIALDGIVVSGEASLDTAALTGESKFRVVKLDDMVLSGSINSEGLIEVKVTKDYKESTVNKILELVENATDRKARTETFVSKIAKIYTPIVLGLAVIVAVFMPLVIEGITYSESIYRALIFLVISCPCAIAISVPLSYFSGIGRASKSGILIKGSDYLDSLRNIRTFIFDKTGTLTTGGFNISKTVSLDSKYSEDDILRIAAIGERFSNHPIAKAVVNKYNELVVEIEISDYKEIAGKGISYKLNSDDILIGNSEFVSYKSNDVIDTVLYVAINANTVGYIILKDEIKENVIEVIDDLKRLKINTKMFTGDNRETAEKVAKQIGIDEVYSEMLPTDKYNKLEEILKSRVNSGDRICFVGDGINDSPVLALADIGISMGGVGSSAAIEASDVVIMTDEISKIKESLKISKLTNFIIKQNLIFAIGTKMLFLSLSVFGLTGMWQAIFADVGVTLITILNSIRILKK